MIKLKTKQEIEIMKEGGRRLREVVRELVLQIKTGMKTVQIDKLAEELIRKQGGEPSFKRVPGYRWSTCLSINEQIVHTPPSDRVLRENDILTLDIGMFYRGFHTDFADTFPIGRTDNKNKSFLSTGKRALDLAVKKVRKGNKLGEISQTIEKEIAGNGYSIVKELTGHGVGRELHEEPNVPGFLDRPIERTLTINPGLVIAVEVIYALGNGAMEHEKNNDWSIQTADKSLSACFEHTVAVTESYTIILT